LSGGEAADCKNFLEVYAAAKKKGTVVWTAADRAYDTNEIRDLLVADKVRCVIPSKCNRVIQIPHSKRLYRLRHKVENFFRKTQDFRRVATRYDKLGSVFLAFVHLASSFIFLRDFVNTP
jgi:transposase